MSERRRGRRTMPLLSLGPLAGPDGLRGSGHVLQDTSPPAPPTLRLAVTTTATAGRLREPAAADGSPMTLRPVVEQLLLDVVADGFVLYCCGVRTAPTALVASYEWADYVDVVTIRNFERITAARIPIHGKVDVFTPTVVVWCYEGPAEWTLRALLNLVHPKHPDAPTATYPAPPSLHIPRAEQRPMTIRPPSPDRANVRATRLAANGPVRGGP